MAFQLPHKGRGYGSRRALVLANDSFGLKILRLWKLLSIYKNKENSIINNHISTTVLMYHKMWFTFNCFQVLTLFSGLFWDKTKKQQKYIFTCKVFFSMKYYIYIYVYIIVFLKKQTILFACWETCLQLKKQHLEPEMEQQTSSKLRTEYIKAVYCHPAYLTYVQSPFCEMPGWRKLKLESRLLREMSTTSDMQMIPP